MGKFYQTPSSVDLDITLRGLTHPIRHTKTHRHYDIILRPILYTHQRRIPGKPHCSGHLAFEDVDDELCILVVYSARGDLK